MPADGVISSPSAAYGFRALRGGGVSLLGLAVSTAVLLVTTPILVEDLGEKGYGIFALGLAASGLLSILDLGTGQALVFRLAPFRTSGSTPAALAITRSALGFMLLLGAFGSGALWLAAGQISQSVDPAGGLLARRTLQFAGLVFAIRMCVGVLSAVTVAFQRFGLATFFSVGGPTAATVAAAFVARRGGDAADATLAICVVTLGVFVVQWGVLRLNRLPVPVAPSWDRAGMAGLWGFASVAALTQICGILLVQLDRFIVARFLGPAAVGDYSIVYSIAFRIQLVLAAASSVVFPMTAEFAGRRDWRRAAEMYAQSVRLLAALGLLLAVPLLVTGDRFVGLWIGSDLAARTFPALALVAVASFILGIVVAPHHILNGLGVPRLNLVIAATVLCVSITANLVLVPRWGITGAGLAAVLASLPALGLVWMADRRLNERRFSGAWAVLLKSAAIGVIAVTSGRAFQALLPSGWLPFAIAASASAVLVGCLAVVAGLLRRSDLSLAFARFGGPELPRGVR